MTQRTPLAAAHCSFASMDISLHHWSGSFHSCGLSCWWYAYSEEVIKNLRSTVQSTFLILPSGTWLISISIPVSTHLTSLACLKQWYRPQAYQWWSNMESVKPWNTSLKLLLYPVPHSFMDGYQSNVAAPVQFINHTSISVRYDMFILTPDRIIDDKAVKKHQFTLLLLLLGHLPHLISVQCSCSSWFITCQFL